jgi:hypothetical protein
MNAHSKRADLGQRDRQGYDPSHEANAASASILRGLEDGWRTESPHHRQKTGHVYRNTLNVRSLPHIEDFLIRRAILMTREI